MKMREAVKNTLLAAAIFLLALVLSILIQTLGVREHVTTVFVFAVFLISLLTEGYVYGVVSAVAGTLESSDAQVTVEPGEGSLELDLSSSVMNQYGRQIKATVLETLERLGVTDARVTVVDKGALDCTLKARVECAVFRSCGASEQNIPWGGVVR